jgi:hypothetical protein
MPVEKWGWVISKWGGRSVLPGIPPLSPHLTRAPSQPPPLPPSRVVAPLKFAPLVHEQAAAAGASKPAVPAADIVCWLRHNFCRHSRAVSRPGAMKITRDDPHLASARGFSVSRPRENLTFFGFRCGFASRDGEPYPVADSRTRFG